MRTSKSGFLAAVPLMLASLAASPAFAQEETDPPAAVTVSGNVAVVSDYRFRGLSLTAGDPAVQGGVTVNHESGFYVGTWASNLDDTPVYGNFEIDLFAGWTKEVSPGLTFDGGLTYYAYPDGKVGKANVWEPYASISSTLGPVSAKVGAAYAWKQDSLGNDDNLYVFTDLGAGIPDTPISLSAHLGYTDGALSPKVLTASGTGGGFDYSVGATYAITEQFTAGISYIGVDGDSIDDFTDDAVVGTVKFTF